jgi:hypothetical protein
MKTRSKSRSNRLTQAHKGALYALDHILENERRIEQQYALPFRAPQKVITSLQQCVHCGKDIALMIFGDNAKDAAGLEAYARLMAEPIQSVNLPTWIITPPADPSSLENPSLLLKVHPTREEPYWIIPDKWVEHIGELSNAHCKSKETRSAHGKVARRSITHKAGRS